MTEFRLGRATGALLLSLALLAPLPALAFDTGGDDTAGGNSTAAAPTPAAPTLKDARADIAAKNWTKAIADLRLIVAANPQSADAYTLLGYSFRNAGNYDRAGQAYARALKIDPRHTGALEYQGVMFVKLGQLDKARANLAKLKAIGGTGTEEYADLAKAIGA
jgi:Flp pilus assembly protein TadD